MTDIVRFKLSSPFVDANACPSMSEIAYGYRQGWIDGKSAADLCLRKYNAGQASELEGQIALALSDQVDELLDQLGETLRDRSTEGPARAWCYLALAWTFENRDRVADPFGLVEMLYADFEYPE